MKQTNERTSLGAPDESRRATAPLPADRDHLDLPEVPQPERRNENGLHILPYLEAAIANAALAAVRRRLRKGKDQHGYSLPATIYQTGQATYEIRN